MANGEEMKSCKDGRIWGQNNKKSGDHLGVLSELKNRYNPETHKWEYIRKGYNPNSAHTGMHPHRPKGLKYKEGCQSKEKNSNWKGGITSLNTQIKNLPEYYHWRSDVYQRDNWTCQTCGKRSEGDLNAHHIKLFSQILRENNIKSIIEAQICKELWDVNNGVTLCKKCHKLTHKLSSEMPNE